MNFCRLKSYLKVRPRAIPNILPIALRRKELVHRLRHHDQNRRVHQRPVQIRNPPTIRSGLIDHFNLLLIFRVSLKQICSRDVINHGLPVLLPADKSVHFAHANSRQHGNLQIIQQQIQIRFYEPNVYVFGSSEDCNSEMHE